MSIRIQLLLSLVLVFCTAAPVLAQNRYQRVEGKGDAVGKNEEIDFEDEETTHAQSIIQVDEGEDAFLMVTSKIFAPPVGTVFRLFDGEDTHVDIRVNTDSLPPLRLRDSSTEIQVEGVTPAATAGIFPLSAEGNLAATTSGAGGGDGGDMHWSAAVQNDEDDNPRIVLGVNDTGLADDWIRLGGTGIMKVYVLGGPSVTYTVRLDGGARIRFGDENGPSSVDISVEGDGSEFEYTAVTLYGHAEGEATIQFLRNNWTGAADITVTAVISDKAADPVPGPDIGKTRDSDTTVTWTIKKRDEDHPPPTSLTKVEGPAPDVWTARQARFKYRGDPDRPPAARPHYEGQVVFEELSDPIPFSFTMDDLKDEWREANPEENTVEEVAILLFPEGTHGSDAFDKNDRISDIHTAGKLTDLTIGAFKAAAFAGDGFGYTLNQTYSCGGAVIGGCTINRRYRNAEFGSIRKSDPVVE